MSDCSTSDFVGWYPIKNIPQGADIAINITYKTGDPPSVVNLTGYAAKLQVRQNYSSPVLLELSTADNSIVLGSAAPNIILNFFKTKTNTMSVYEGMIYDLVVTSPTGERTKIIEGTFSLLRKITE